MSILVLGGQGKTASPIAALLHTAGLPFLVASRSTSSSSPYKQAHFDWLKEETYGNPFSKAVLEGLAPVATTYLVPPPIFDLAPPMIKFVDYAQQNGVKRFVLLSGSTIERGGPAMGQVHEHLATLNGIKYGVLRPTWFMEEHQRLAIKNESKIYSAAGDGRVPFVSTGDIARVAIRLLTDEEVPETEPVILGPEPLSYDQVAGILSSVLGREITHVKLTEDELTKHLESTGMPVEDARMLAGMDVMIREGAEDKTNNVVEELTGAPPMPFRDFAAREKDTWF
ncbi:hypothetical protein DL770_000727 [Monosporascus sp. CRB-9-2]|nr:hypothetical protein DL770_000727 [Monosporascus sp. CRB-9-2]